MWGTKWHMTKRLAITTERKRTIIYFSPIRLSNTENNYYPGSLHRGVVNGPSPTSVMKKLFILCIQSLQRAYHLSFNNPISRILSLKYAEICVQEYLSHHCLWWQTIGKLTVHRERISSANDGHGPQRNTAHSLKQWYVSICADARNIWLYGRNR